MEDFSLSPTGVTRRVFVKGLGVVGVGLVLATVGGCSLDKLLEAIANRPTRRRLRVGSPEVDADIATYRNAVSLMKGLPASDPRSWDNQAGIHGTTAGFLWCQHGTDHFFDWHRAYLLNFERICQKLTGNAHFGLPYWNWNQDPAIHPAFLDPSSPLFLARNTTTMAGSGAVATSQLDPIFGDTNFFTFSHQIEGTPHNTVHGHIGGTMGTGASARDPIFWAHHCMVDYCWAKWNLELGNDNTNDPTWANTDNTHFVDANGNPTSATGAATTLMPLLSYQYESSAIGSSPATAALRTKSAYQQLEQRVRAGADVRFDIKRRISVSEKAVVSIARPFSKETRLAPGEVAAIVNSDTAKERIFVSVAFARLPASSDFSVRVFVNLPSANERTSTADPHYAGSFAFFGTEPPGAPREGHPHQQPRFLVNITDTLQRLKRSGELREGAPMSVQLVAVPFRGKLERENTQLELDRIEIIITPVIVKSR
jgi:tyrosinase